MSHDVLYKICICVLGGSWVLVYAIIIQRGLRDRSYGIPLIALCGNISWEFEFAFVSPYEPFQQIADIVWFCIDLAILWTVVRYGPREFPALSPRAFYALLAVALAAAYSAVRLLTDALGEPASLYIGFGDTLMMSAMFIGMALARGCLRGQSLLLAYTKWIGTAFGCVAYYFFDDEHGRIALIGLGGICIFVFDGIYVALLHRLRSHAAPAPRLPAQESDPSLLPSSNRV